MHLPYSLYEFACFFVIYAFCGWCTEVVFAAVNSGKFVNRGFLNGPVCPIYGFGVVLVIALLTPLKDNLPLLFIGSVLLTTALEFVVGFVLEKAFSDKWWDYSREHFNVKGYICLKFSLIWGLACVFVVSVIQPLFAGLVALVPQTAGQIIVSVLLAAFLGDAILAASSAWTLKKRLRLLDSLGRELRKVSDGLGEKLSDTAISARDKGEEAMEKAGELRESAREFAEENREKLTELRQNARSKGEETLERAEELRESAREFAGENREKLTELRQSARSKSEENLARLEELKQRYAALLNEKHFGHNRLLKAFEGYGKRTEEAIADLRHRLPRHHE